MRYIEITDERDPGNPLSPVLGGVSIYSKFNEDFFALHQYSPTQTEKFAHDSAGHLQLAKFLTGKFSLRQRGTVLEVGPGQNWYLVNTFQETGVSSSVIDGRQDPHWRNLNMGDDTEPLWHSPRKERTTDKGIDVYSGDVRNLSTADSDLRRTRFGLILFNGSWSSGYSADNYNYSILWTYKMREHERAWKKLKDEQKRAQELKNYTGRDDIPIPQYQNPNVTEPISNGIDETIDVCRKHLAENGLVGVVSSRYAYHGAGFGLTELPEEKLGFLDLFTRFQHRGAKKIYLIGVSPIGFTQAAYEAFRNATPYKGISYGPVVINKVRSRLSSVVNLRDTKGEFARENLGLSDAAIDEIIRKTKDVRALRKLARIDAIFAEF